MNKQKQENKTTGIFSITGHADFWYLIFELENKIVSWWDLEIVKIWGPFLIMIHETIILNYFLYLVTMQWFLKFWFLEFLVTP